MTDIGVDPTLMSPAAISLITLPVACRGRTNTKTLLLARILNAAGFCLYPPVVRSCTERMNQRNVDVLRTSMSFVLDPASLRVPTRTTTG